MAKVRQLIEQLSPEELKRSDEEAKRVRVEQHREYLATRAIADEGESPMQVRDRHLEPALDSGGEGGQEIEAGDGPGIFGIFAVSQCQCLQFTQFHTYWSKFL